MKAPFEAPSGNPTRLGDVAGGHASGPRDAESVLAPRGAVADQLATLASIPGFDAGLGLRLCGGRPERLMHVLQRYVDLYRGGGGVDALAGHLRSGHFDDLQRLAHSLNGASGVIGATRIQARAAALEAALAQRRPVADLATATEALRAALDELIGALDLCMRSFAGDPASSGAEPPG